MEFRYDDLVHTNSPLLASDDQERVRKTRLLIAGCGTASVIAEAATRLGFERFILVDGDRVALTNINRQAYVFSDVGKNKATVLSRKLEEINPQCSVTTVARFLSAENVVGLVEMCDIVIDAIDALAINAIVSLHKEAKNQGKSIVYPFNVGWGGAVLVFTPQTISIEEMLKVYSEAALGELLEATLLELMGRLMGEIPAYLSETISGLRLREVTKFPQPAIAALQCSVLAATAALKLTLGLPVKLAPHVISFDPWLAASAAVEQSITRS